MHQALIFTWDKYLEELFESIEGYPQGTERTEILQIHNL